ncbi:gem-associated protein 5 [Clarias gariepinus]
MHERLLPASPNWYCSRCSDVSRRGVLGFGAKSSVFLLEVSASSAAALGELRGHTERVSGFSFCRHDGQEDVCASSSDDKTIKIWDSERRVMLEEHQVHQNTISALHWSPTQKALLVSGDEKGVVVCHWFGRGDTRSFFPEPRTIFCLSCSPHTENHVAIGYKDGMIVLIDINKKGEVIHRLRGHEEEIHALAWCPDPREDTLYSRADDNADVSSELGEVEQGGYLASGSRDQTIRIWSTTRGKGVMTLKLPFLKRRGVGVDPGVKERLWLTVHWPKGRPSQVVSSCFGGEMVVWDLTRSGKQKWTLLGSSSDGQNHSRIVFNMSSVCVDGRELLVSTSMDRDVKCWDLETLECCWTLPTMGGFIYSMSFSPVATGCLALGVGDNMIRVWNTLSLQNPYETRTFWQGIKSKVTALAWHPVKEGSLAFGTDDGKVGIYEVYSNKPPQISSTYHRRTVYSLDWGPPVPPLSFGTGDKPDYTLYSCAGEGVIFQHDPWKLSDEASNIDKLIRDSNNIKHKLSPHTDLSWKPDRKVLAIGNEDGSIEVYQAPSLKLLCTVQQHHKIINALRWHHQHSGQPELHCLLASGSSNALVYIHDLRSAIENPPESPVLVTEAFRTLSGHTNKITGLAWSPHHDAHLVTVCYDGTAQVWDVLKQEPVCNYRGHTGRVLCVQWSPVNPDLIWTGADDFTVQEWAASKQEHVRPPKSRRRAEMEKKKAPTKKAKKKRKVAEKRTVKTDESDSLMGEEAAGGTGSGGEEGQTEDEAEDEEREHGVSTVTGVSQETSSVWEKAHVNGERSFPTVRKEEKEEKKKDRLDLCMKKRKPRSILPLSTSMDHRAKEELQQDCLTLAAVKHAQGQTENCVPGTGDHIQLGLFTDRQALYRMFQEEEDSHVEAGHYESMMYLRLWKGDLPGALQLATEKGQLNDHLVSLAPMAGFQVWVRTVEAYVKQLCMQEQFLKAASHLVSINKLYEAIGLLKSHQFYREAIALAKARMQPEDPVLKDLYTSWSAVLERDGHYTTAAKCYLAMGSGFDAAKVIAKKGDVMSLKAAASLAKLTGERDLCHSLALRCAKDLVQAQDWLAAQEILSTQDSLLGHRLVFCVCELLGQRLSHTGSVTWTPLSSHAWSKPGDERFLAAVQGVWRSALALDATDPTHLGALRQQLRAVENPPTTAGTPVKQLLPHMALDVALCALSELLDDCDSLLQELLRALTRVFKANHFSLMDKMCQLLLPGGMDSLAVYKQRVQTDGECLGASQSLEALVCYQLMYKNWWRCCSPKHVTVHRVAVENGENGDAAQQSEPGDAEAFGLSSEGSVGEDFWNVLLSEPHAALQSTQRALEGIQSRVAALVQQHSHVQGESEEPMEEQHTSDPESRSSAEVESFPVLVARVAELQKTLAAVPDHVKNYAFPDVLECCLVLLYTDKHLGGVSPRLRERASALLLAYASPGSLYSTRERFSL